MALCTQSKFQNSAYYSLSLSRFLYLLISLCNELVQKLSNILLKVIITFSYVPCINKYIYLLHILNVSMHGLSIACCVYLISLTLRSSLHCEDTFSLCQWWIMHMTWLEAVCSLLWIKVDAELWEVHRIVDIIREVIIHLTHLQIWIELIDVKWMCVLRYIYLLSLLIKEVAIIIPIYILN